MKVDNPFDRALKVRNPPEPFLSAAVDVTDTLDLAWASVRAVFEEHANPQQAIAVAELMLRAAGRLDPLQGSNSSHLSRPLSRNTDYETD